MFKDIFELLTNGKTSLEVVIFIIIGDILAGFIRDMINLLVANRLGKSNDIPKEILECKAILKDFRKCRRKLRRHCWLARHLKSKRLKAYFSSATKFEAVLYREYIKKFQTDIPPN